MSRQSKKNSVRIIAGEWRGRRLPVVDSTDLRPSTDRARETLFNWLMHEVAGAKCLDLFAGSGALGFESLSRGASYVQLVETSSIAVAAIRENIELLNANRDTTRAKVDHIDALRFLANAPEKTFDIAYLDPPFKSDLICDAAELLEAHSWLNESASIYIECDTRKNLEDLPPNWHKHKQGRVGQSAYYLFQRGAK